LLVSACLLGVACRYDGERLDESQCRQRLKRLARRFNLVPVCPEQLGGLPTPRKAVSFRILPGEDPAKPEGVVTDIDGLEKTANLKAGAGECVRLALELGIKQALLKESSPSCGVNTVYLGQKKVKGEGITARALRRAGIRVLSEEEEQKLHNKAGKGSN